MAESGPSREGEELPDALHGEVVDPDAGPTEGSAVEELVLRQHVGPLPSSDWLAEVEQLSPGSTKAIIDDYRDERRHQRDMQRRAIDVDQRAFTAFDRYQRLQLAAATLVVLLFGVAGIVFIAVGLPVAGLVLLASELAVLAGVFFGREVLNRRTPLPPAESDDRATNGPDRGAIRGANLSEPPMTSHDANDATEPRGT